MRIKRRTVDRPLYSVELHIEEIARRLGLSPSTFRRRRLAGVYQLEVITRQAARIRIDGMPPEMQKILSAP